MADSIDDLFARLQVVSAELDEIGDSNFDARITLQEERAEIRKKLQAIDDQHPLTQRRLASELAMVTKQLEDAEAARLNPDKQGGFAFLATSRGGRSAAEEVNEKIDKATGIDELQARVDELQARLGITPD